MMTGITVRALISSCNNVYYGSTMIHLYDSHSHSLKCVAGLVDEEWKDKEVDWWRVNKIKEYGLTFKELEIHVL